jgi:adenine-specific DNA-methyltransferase
LGRYYADKNNTLWLIYTDSKFKNQNEIKQYPNIKTHLDKYKNVITSDNKPYGLHRARDERFFLGEKIIAQRKCAGRPVFTYANFDCYVSATFYIIKSERIDLQYLTGLLNSKLLKYWLKKKGKMQGSNYQIDKEPLLQMPVYMPDKTVQKRVGRLVAKITDLNNGFVKIMNKNTSETENVKKHIQEVEDQIDQAIYDLYGLTQQEINIIEES